MPGTCWSVALPQVKPGEAILEPYGLADHGGTRRTLSRNFTCAERVPWAAMSSMGRPVVPISRCPEAPSPGGPVLVERLADQSPTRCGHSVRSVRGKETPWTLR